jgi:hypothetical protein
LSRDYPQCHCTWAVRRTGRAPMRSPSCQRLAWQRHCRSSSGRGHCQPRTRHWLGDSPFWLCGYASATHEWFRAFAARSFSTCRPQRPREVRVLPILLLRDAILPYRRVQSLSAIGACQGRYIDLMRQRVEPSCGFALRSLHSRSKSWWPVVQCQGIGYGSLLKCPPTRVACARPAPGATPVPRCHRSYAALRLPARVGHGLGAPVHRRRVTGSL